LKVIKVRLSKSVMVKCFDEQSELEMSDEKVTTMSTERERDTETETERDDGCRQKTKRFEKGGE
jgi:hypothetical protein